jgi:PAS domain-containing protein
MFNTSSTPAQDSTVDYQVIFESMPGSFIILQPNAPHYPILAISDELLEITARGRQNVVGKSVFEVYPESPEAITATGPSNLRISLQNAVQFKVLDQMPVMRYDIPNADGEFEERYWSASSKPVLNTEGEVMYIIHATNDVTNQIKAEKRGITLRKIEETYNLFMQAPVAACIVTGPENIVELANEEILRVLGRTPDIIGKPLFEAIPEAKGQGFPELLDQVRKTGEPFYATEYPTALFIDGKEEFRYYNFVYQPYYENPGDKAAAGVFSVAHDVTDQVVARKKVEDAKEGLNFRNALFEAQNEVTPDGVLIVDGNGKMILHNRRFAEIWNIPQEIIDSKDEDAALKHAMTQVVDPQGFIDRVTYLYAQQKESTHHEVLFKDGRVIESKGTPIVAENGVYYGWAWYFRDITHRIQQEQKFRNVVEQASDLIAIFRGENLVVEVANGALLELWQVGPDALNKPFQEILPEMKE